MRPRLSPYCLAAALAAAAGCRGQPAPGGTIGVGGAGAGACDGREIVLVNCSGCHDGVSETTGFLDLTSPESTIAHLVGKPAAGPKCAGGGAVLIDGDGSGLFVDKLRAPPPCGDQMPQGTFPLSADEIGCVASWVAAVAADAPPDAPPAVCPAAAGDVGNAACNDVAASGPCVAPVMLDDNAPGPLGGPLAEGLYDLAARVVYTNPGGATGPAGEPLARTIVLTGAEASWSMQEATLSAAAASRRTTTLTVAGPSMQLRATATCPADGDASAGAGTTTLYYTAADSALILYQLGAAGPIQADTYTRR